MAKQSVTPGPSLLRLGPGGAAPLHRRICESILALIDSGALRPGDRLPPTRHLATSAGVHRSTVVRAYDELRALGFVESTQGSYTTVRRRARPIGASDASGDGRRQAARVDWLGAATRRARRVREIGPFTVTAPAPDGVIDFDRLAADPALAPSDELRACLRNAVARGYTIWLTLPESVGGEALWLARLAAAGVRVAPGSRFFTKQPTRVHFRLSIACADESHIDDGCRRLGQVLAGAAAGPAVTAGRPART